MQRRVLFRCRTLSPRKPRVGRFPAHRGDGAHPGTFDTICHKVNACGCVTHRPGGGPPTITDAGRSPFGSCLINSRAFTALRAAECCEGFAPGQIKSKSFHRPAGGEVLFLAEKVPKNALAESKPLRLQPQGTASLFAERGPAPTRASKPSNKGALLPRSASKLGLL